MKEIDVLLERYAKGILSDEEQVRLNQLTRRDEVWAAASMRAHRLKRNRRAAISVVAALLVVVSVGVTLNLRPDVAEPKALVVARTNVAQESEAAVSAAEVVQVMPQQEGLRQAYLAEKTSHVQLDSQAARVAQIVVDPVPEAAEVPLHLESDPVVACNTQCSPDSVISDIWKFLKA